ncbi:MAG: molybdenum cofactor biosynthesis protein MoaE [Bryobacteraceae bacterium]|nr:molybdenum cofactor biosynthesis protein MoaE [Bryobacteraceae bacterium]
MVRDIVGRSEERLDVPDTARLETVFDHYATQFPRLQAMATSVVLARNHEFSHGSTPLADGDEIAFLPPVSGGSGPYTSTICDEAGHFFAITRQPIDPKEITARVLRPEDGAVVDFEGVVRNNTNGRQTCFLEYECYEPMAIKMMAQIGREIAAAYPIGRIAMVHRLGRLEIGEASVSVIVTAPHRRPAFEAALEGINRLKKLVPIWKKEYFVDGEVWVEGEWDESVKQR